jgi:hypothetical protein
MPTLEPAVVRVDQETCPPSEATRILRQEHTGALVIDPDPLTIPLLALHQELLPLRVGFSNVVPKTSKKGKVPATKRISQITRELGNVAQMINEKLSLALSVGRVGV